MTMFIVIKGFSQTDSDIIRNMTEQWKAAYNSGDAKNFNTIYSESSRYISSHVTKLELMGKEKVLNNFQNGMNMGGRIDSIEILDIQINNDLATVLCKYQATNSGVTVIGRNLLVMRKNNLNWEIVIHMTVV